MKSRREVLERASLLIEGDRIAATGAAERRAAQYPSAEVIVIPGMVDTRTHLFQTLLKGRGDDMVPKEWFSCMTGPSAVEPTEADVCAAAVHVGSIRSGVRTLVASCTPLRAALALGHLLNH